MARATRRVFLRGLAGGAAAAVLAPLAGRRPCAASAATPPRDRPNVVLAMCDDLGWGDTGYNGHPALKTPNLDALARAGLRLDRFYAGAPVCSPTRGSCLTGRHPYRYGIFFANVGHLPREEVTLAEALKAQGYATGHFGKWHLGTLTRTEKDSNRGGPAGAAHYSPPWDNGFDVCFSTEAKVPTWDPMCSPGTGAPYGTAYWTGPGAKETENLEGDDSRVIMDRVLPFIRQAAADARPFLAVVWFHTPHEPVVAGPDYLAMYRDVADEKARHYYGCITAMDEQVGRLRKALRDLGLADNTILWFCSDNGPEHQKGPGSAGPLRGRKRSLFEGGVRVPGLLEWPARLRAARATAVPACTSDYFPTVLDAVGFAPAGRPRPADGVSLLPLIDGTMTERPQPIGFESDGQASLTDNRYKIITQDKGRTYMLFDLVADPGETTDLAAAKPDVLARLRGTLDQWRASCKESLAGRDYARP